MKGFVITLSICLLVMASALFAESFHYSDSWGTDGMNLESQSRGGVDVVFSIQNLSIEDALINGQYMKSVQLPGIFLPNDEGAPNLPGTGRYIAIPQGATVSYTISAYRTETFSNMEIEPAPRIPWENEDGPLDYHKNPVIYSEDAYYPASPVKVSEPTQIRGVDVVILGVTPFQYNPVTKELLVYRDIRVEMTFNGGNGHFGTDRLRSRWWDPLFRDMLLNYEMLPQMDYNRAFQGPTEETGAEYLIICPTDPEFQQWADSIKVFRTLQGIKTEVVTLDVIGGNNPTTVENYINNAYNTWQIPPAAILLFGDYGSSPTNSVTSPIYNSYTVSDNIYADVNNNQMPDIIAARITANNATQLETMVTKFIHYEKNPPTDPNFYAHPMTCLGYQTERWFQICTESVAGFWEQVHGKTVNRVNAIYNGSPTTTWSTATNTSTVLNYFGPNGLGYIPATPGQINCTWNGTGNDVVTGMNNGAYMLLHRDHGAETLWGEPDFSNSHINYLTNTDLCFVWSVNCLTGKYNYSGECMVEKLHRHTYNGENAGALGVIGDAEVSYSFVNDTYVWGAFDNMWPDFMPGYGTTPASHDVMPGFANAAGKYFLQQSSWPYNVSNKEVTYHLFHDHADAFLSVYSEMPQNLTVNHNAVLFGGQSSFTVTADDGAFIALTVNGEIIGTGTGTGAPLAITIPPQFPGNQMMVTVTKQNYYRYSQPVMITAASGPYLYVVNPVINDPNFNGNNIPECGETVEMQLNLTNLGIEQATNITATVSCPDTFVNVLNGLTTIAAVDTADTMVAGSFTLEINPNTPHQTNCLLNVHMEADSAGIPGGYTWDQVVGINIREGAHIELSDNNITYPNTFLNFTSAHPITIYNTGPDTLYVTDVSSDIPQFAPDQTAMTIAPGGDEVLNVGFTPDDTLTYNGTITISNSDPVNFTHAFTVEGLGINAPDIEAGMDTITQTVYLTDSVTIPITIYNQGLGDLIFNAQIAGWDPGNGEGAGGSDTYGHMWIDSDEPNGPTFEWYDITLTGTELSLTGNNSISEALSLGFPFTFYGESYDHVRVCTNGWLSFTTFSVAYNNFSLPNNMAPRAMIAPLWDDLNFQTDSKAYYENQGNKIIILYQDVYRVTGEGPYTFEVVLYDNDNIVIQYQSLQGLVHDYTVGIQNHDATDGLTIAFNETYVHDNLAVLISRATWVSVNPLSGVIPGQAQTDLELTFITNNFPEDDFWASLQIESNDPDEGVYIVPIHMIVSSVVGIENDIAALPTEFRLYQNMPNPFNPTTIIRYALPTASEVQLVIYNMLGQKVKTLVKGRQDAKLHQIQWDGTNDNGVKVASGIYLYHLKADNFVSTRKMILMK